jgi:hypothetical protein
MTRVEVGEDDLLRCDAAAHRPGLNSCGGHTSRRVLASHGRQHAGARTKNSRQRQPAREAKLPGVLLQLQLLRGGGVGVQTAWDTCGELTWSALVLV